MKRFLVLSVAVLSLAGCDLLKNGSSSPSNPTAPSTTTFDYTAMGASDAIGYGSSNVCFPFTACPNGTGYIQDIARMYQADHATMTLDLLNMGIPGAVLGPTIMNLGNSLGLGIPANFLDGELPFIQTNASLVTIFAGGNDVRTVGSALQAGRGGSDINGFILSQASQFGADLNTLMTGVKAKSPNAKIIILNLPNLAGTPYYSGYSLTDKQVVQTISVSFSAQINAQATHGASVIDLMCDPNMYQPSFFSSIDGFHPDDQGYAYMAGLVYNVIKGTPATAPKSSCSQMKLF
jgi:lysophospholipase L1-like esterase